MPQREIHKVGRELSIVDYIGVFGASASVGSSKFKVPGPIQNTELNLQIMGAPVNTATATDIRQNVAHLIAHSTLGSWIIMTSACA